MTNLIINNSFKPKKSYKIQIDNNKTIKKKIAILTNNSQKISTKKKINIFNKLKKKLISEKIKVLNLISFETGVSIKDSEYEFIRVIDCINLTLKILKRKKINYTKDFVINNKGLKVEVLKTPLNLIFAITPFNLPLILSVHKIFPAIISDAKIIIKPSEKTPLSCKYLINSFYKSGLPRSFIQYVIGSNPEKIVKEVFNYKKIDMVSFTGSSKVGLKIKNIMVKKNHQLKKYVPELGGCSSLIICEDCDIKKAIKITIDGCFKYSGQRCTSVRRVIVDKKIIKKFIKLLLIEVKKINFGNPFDKNIHLGPVIDKKIYKNIKSQVSKAIKSGANLLHGGFYKHNIISPIILDNVKIDMGIVSKETFGPVCPIIMSNNLDEAIKIANNTNYKMAGSILTNSKKKALKAYLNIEVGQFSINGPPGFRLEEAPFGGFENSGNGEKEGLIMASDSMKRIRVLYTHN